MSKLVLGCLLLLPFAYQAGKSKYYELSSSFELTMPEPAKYRQWKYVGSSVIPNELNSHKAIFPGIHQVYIDPDSYKAHQEKGAFPDGTIIVMEVQHMKKAESVGGFGYFTTGGMDILVQLKDRRAFKGNGWGYYLFSDKNAKAGVRQKAPEDNRCTSCHRSAAEEDEVFTQYYPELRQKK